MASVNGRPCKCNWYVMCLYHYAEEKKRQGIGYSDHPSKVASISTNGSPSKVRKPRKVSNR
jgi:hypothetical protein